MQTADTPPDLTALYRDLNEKQADGLACIVCNADFTTSTASSVPVGYSLTGSQVFACAQPCASHLVVHRSDAEAVGIR